jgi:hypothetical protein
VYAAGHRIGEPKVSPENYLTRGYLEEGTMSLAYDIQETDDEDEGIVEYEYVDEPQTKEDGVYAPSNCVLFLLVILILLVGAGIGVGTYFAYEEMSDGGSPSVSENPPTPAASPITLTVAPVNPPAPSQAPVPEPTEPSITPAPVELFVCPICGEDLDVTNPDGVFSFDGQPDRSCEELLIAAEMGNINEINCGLLQSQIQDICGCREERTDESVLALLGSVVGLEVAEEGTIFFEAANWLLNEDPRFVPLEMRRLQSGMGTPDPTASPAPSWAEPDSDTVSDAPSSAGTPSDTTDAPTQNVFLCTICGEGKEFTNLGAVLSFVDEPDLTCQELQEFLALADEGNFTESECTDLHLLTDVPCGCAASNNTDTLSIQNPGSNSPTMTPTVIVEGLTLSDISDEELIQRYLMALFYFQTTSNRETQWNSNCTAADNPEPGNSICNYVTPVRLQNGALAEGVLLQIAQASRWLSEESECDWAGVTCSDGEVESIFLGTNAATLNSNILLPFFDRSHLITVPFCPLDQ